MWANVMRVHHLESAGDHGKTIGSQFGRSSQLRETRPNGSKVHHWESPMVGVISLFLEAVAGKTTGRIANED